MILIKNANEKRDLLLSSPSMHVQAVKKSTSALDSEVSCRVSKLMQNERDCLTVIIISERMCEE